MGDLISQKFKLTLELRLVSRNGLTEKAVTEELLDFMSDGKLGERLFPDRLANALFVGLEEIRRSCDAWGGKPGEKMGLICSEPRGHEGDHDGSGCGRWPNNLNTMSRIVSARLMANQVGEGWPSIDAAEEAGREEARTGGGWQRQPAEALDFVYMEARDDEMQKMRDE